MSIYNIYSDKDNDRIVKYDSKSKNIFWSKYKEGISVNNETETELRTLVLEKVVSREKDIEIINLDKNNEIIKDKNKDGYFLYNGNDIIGSLDKPITSKKIKEMKVNGCIFIVYIDQSIRKIILFVIKEYDKMVKSNKEWINQSTNKDNEIKINNNYVDQEAFIKTQQSMEIRNSENMPKYCEATIKIPVLEYTVDDDKIDKILKLTEQLNTKINVIHENISKNESKDLLESNLNNKNLYNNLVNENIELKKKNNSLIREKRELQETSNSLANERKFLTNEIQKARLYAINEITRELKPATVYIESQLDLDLQRDIFNEVLEIIKRSVGESMIEGVLENKEIINEIKEFSNNIEAKIQALKEIKDLFKKVNIMSDIRFGGDSK